MAIFKEKKELKIKIGRVRSDTPPKQKTFLQKVMRAAQKSGHVSSKTVSVKSGHRGRKPSGRARFHYSKSRLFGSQRRVIIKARIVRHTGAKYRAASLKRYMGYLQRDGVTKDGEKAHVFDARNDIADEVAFSKSCQEDRHHFRFIIAPEDMAELTDIKTFTRDLMQQMEQDCGTRLEWVAVDHWNTDNPHIHLIVRGVAQDGKDLVIARDYMGYGFRSRAEDLVSLELGPKPVHEIQQALDREVTAERWTRIDREIMGVADDLGYVDLRAARQEDAALRTRRLMIGRLQHLEKMALATNIGPSQWHISLEAESTLRDLSIRGDIIKTMHRAFMENGIESDDDRNLVIGSQPQKPIIGRLMDKGLHDELTGEAYAIIDGVDGKAHYIRFKNMEILEHAPNMGGLVEFHQIGGEDGKPGARVLSVRSDLPLDRQITATGASWLDHRLVGSQPMEMAQKGFGHEVRQAMTKRLQYLRVQGLTQTKDSQLVPVPNLLKTLREQEIKALTEKITSKTGLSYQPHSTGKTVQGIYRQRFSLASGRYALLDNGLGFQLVPWSASIERRLGAHISGVVRKSGGIDWNHKTRGLSM